MKRELFSSFPVAVVGAGPVGLAAAAHLAERGLPFVVFVILLFTNLAEVLA